MPSSVSKWFQRRFEFTFPVDLHPNLIIRLMGAPARLEELTSPLEPRILTTRPESDVWSIQENAGHLWNLEELWRARVQDFLSGSKALTPADLTNRLTFDSRHNERPLKEILEGFRKDRRLLTDALLPLSPDDFVRTSRHPRLRSPMRLADHLWFVAEHDDHHLARIWELSRTLERND